MKSNWLINYEHLLQTVCKYGGAEQASMHNLEVYSSSSSTWPNLGMHVQNFDELSSRELEKLAQPITLLLPQSKTEKELINTLKKIYNRHGVWYEMEAERTVFSLPHNIDFSKISRVTNPHDFKRWMELVENTLLAERNLNHQVFWNLMEDEEIILVLGHHENKAVSAAMFHPYQNTLGLYFVVTLPEYRNHGLGSLLTQYAFHLGEAMDIEYLVLQATPQGKKVYDRFGFSVLDEVDVFYTLNTIV
ncbi:Acetyltransferase (GNAT) family protein [Lishizhenia tianjinensis]|uniref:Acetyltransferase (GNAT) family protein n=1 Tax=Lishizhenia tianjinensis TaxID=477690 RepID=A0A1I6XEX7_9FLAO|nr:GNAT family N-acetyltransferase [Lishizhenia tianjinensis]SFT36928.1 Acetyltransferase (GNAT) family protein [Lishizhenia tianjinensis]